MQKKCFDKENESVCPPKYFISSHPPIHLSRRMRLPWTSAEEETLKEGERRHFGPHDKNIPGRQYWNLELVSSRKAVLQWTSKINVGISAKQIQIPNEIDVGMMSPFLGRALPSNFF